MQSNLLLEVNDLKTYFYLDDGIVRAVDGTSFALSRSSTLGVVGESGCGKSVTAYSILKLVARPGKIVSGSILYHRESAGRDGVVDLAKLPADGDVIRSIRGAEIAMIFQEPMTSFSPVHSIGYQIGKVLELHQRIPEKQARERTADLLNLVGIPRARERLDAYPFQLSGGMRQRAMIAMALSCSPSLLVADEPTTALDVTTQAQIMDLLRKLQAEMGMAVMLITHNLGVVMEMCQDVIVMYLGQVVEHASVRQLFKEPMHPYTQALFRSIPHLTQKRGVRLDPIEGAVPDAYNRPPGCAFHPRCKRFIQGKCDEQQPGLVNLPDGRSVRCFLYGEGV